MHRFCGSLLLLLLLIGCSGVSARSAIPGTTQTISGYDTELGADAICWRCQSADNVSNAIEFPNPLVRDFVVSDEGVTLLRACPTGNNMTGHAPDLTTTTTTTTTTPSTTSVVDFVDDVFRTGRFYNYTVSFSLNMTSLGASKFHADGMQELVAVQVLLCVAGVSGFCSPFIHEEANVRLEELKRATGFVEVPEIGYLHGGSHVHSPYVKLHLPADRGPIFNTTIQVPLQVNRPGDYYAITALHLFFQQNDTATNKTRTIRVDMANALSIDSRLLRYQDPPVLLQVPTRVLQFSYSVIGLAAFALVYLLSQLVRYRHHEVTKLAQGHWLCVTCTAGLVATISAFLHQPRHDWYCRTSFPLTLVSLQVFYAVTVGRIWRIHALVSPLLRTSSLALDNNSNNNNNNGDPMEHTRQRRWTVFLRERLLFCSGWSCPSVSFWLSCFCCCRRRGDSNHPQLSDRRRIRRQVTDRDLLRIVGGLCLPQIVLQVLSVIFQPRQLVVDLNDAKSVGRYVCDYRPEDDNDNNMMMMMMMGNGVSFLSLGMYWLGFVVLLLLLMAHQSRQLPSLLNETQKVFDGTLTSIVLLILGLAVLVLTNDDPSSSPGVPYLVLVALVLSITLNTTIRIVGPPLRVIRRGETIVVSQLVQDHAQQQRQKSQRRLLAAASSTRSTATSSAAGNNNSYRSSIHISGLNQHNNSSSAHNSSWMHMSSSNSLRSSTIMTMPPSQGNSSAATSSLRLAGSMRQMTTPTAATTPSQQQPQQRRRLSTNTEEGSTEGDLFLDGFFDDQPVVYRGDDYSSNYKQKPVRVREDQAPPKRLIVPMVALQEKLAFTNKRVLSGYSVSRYDWETVVEMVYKLGCYFHDRVEFAWHEKQTTTTTDDDDNNNKTNHPKTSAAEPSELELLFDKSSNLTIHEAANDDDDEAQEVTTKPSSGQTLESEEEQQLPYQSLENRTLDAIGADRPDESKERRERVFLDDGGTSDGDTYITTNPDEFDPSTLK